ncbi:CTD small phosphatase-like protein 2 [Porphyridium purpureum]|uniref:CTD small phosphatase-like protein 2 n=1 Tax=Porphyridium purpureum TaxID=35688 RepID=A0A5J4YX59_PORPP|nr:CTD small phosphatase-like protein 2 [Porphyridium purpureum]|eukprot:POR9111..scf209_3
MEPSSSRPRRGSALVPAMLRVRRLRGRYATETLSHAKSVPARHTRRSVHYMAAERATGGVSASRDSEGLELGDDRVAGRARKRRAVVGGNSDAAAVEQKHSDTARREAAPDRKDGPCVDVVAPQTQDKSAASAPTSLARSLENSTLAIGRSLKYLLMPITALFSATARKPPLLPEHAAGVSGVELVEMEQEESFGNEKEHHPSRQKKRGREDDDITYSAGEPDAASGQVVLLSDLVLESVPLAVAVDASETKPEEPALGTTTASESDARDAVFAPEPVIPQTHVDAAAELVASASQELLEDYEIYLFIASLPPLSLFPKRAPSLSPKMAGAPRVTLVLDLDETLVHCSTDAVRKWDVTFDVDFGGATHTVYAKKRPFLDHFLAEVSGFFEVVIFTASHEAYADRLLDIIDPQKKWIHHRCFRDSCLQINSNYIKDLTVLGRDLRHLVLVDNSPQASPLVHIDNLIPISTWFDDDSDRELLILLDFLSHLIDSDDVRPLISRSFRTREKVTRTVELYRQNQRQKREGENGSQVGR